VTAKHPFRKFAFLPLVLAAGAACSQPSPQGTYSVDLSGSDDVNIALAGEVMALSLTFTGKDVTMAVNALGESKVVDVHADFSGERVILTRDDEPNTDRMVLLVKDADTLQCERCPQGMPGTWKKQK
jgi:hypothetical protein